MIHPLINYNLPFLIVFDLDFTLWPFEAGAKSNLWYPFQRTWFGVVDIHNKSISIHPDVTPIFEELEKERVKICVTSNNTEAEANQDILYLFCLNDFITVKELGPGTIQQKLIKIHKQTGIRYSDMLLYDDQPSNVLDASDLDVLGIVVENGMTLDVYRNGLEHYRTHKKLRSQSINTTTDSVFVDVGHLR